MSVRAVLALAGLADAAVKGLHPVKVLPGGAGTATAEDVDAATIVDTEDRQWLVRAPRTQAAGVRLDAEARLLDVIGTRLPFAVPVVEGTCPLPTGGRALVSRRLPGHGLEPARLDHDTALAADLGRALAALHELPATLFEEAGAPVYSAEEYRQRRLAEVDRAASTGHVPAPLLTRWEQALEEAGAWRFSPCPLHADLAPDSVLVDGSRVTGLTDWSSARVADPADDLSWLAVGVPEAAFTPVLAAYTAARSESVDTDLVRRARLAGELAVARWLLHGVGTDDDAVVGDAVAMLTDLADAVADQHW